MYRFSNCRNVSATVKNLRLDKNLPESTEFKRQNRNDKTGCSDMLRQGSVTGVILVGRPDSLGFHSVT